MQVIKEIPNNSLISVNKVLSKHEGIIVCIYRGKASVGDMVVSAIITQLCANSLGLH